MIEKTGTWLSYGGERMGQGRENARVFLKENKDIRDKLENALRKKMEIPVSGQAMRRHARGQRPRQHPRGKTTDESRGCRGSVGQQSAAVTLVRLLQQEIPGGHKDECPPVCVSEARQPIAQGSELPTGRPLDIPYALEGHGRGTD